MKDYMDMIRSKLHEVDLILRPKALIVNPIDEKMIRESIPDIESKVVIRSLKSIPEGSAYLIERSHLEYLSEENDDRSI